MTSWLEFKKIKRTGILPVFTVGGILAASIPILNLMMRSEDFLYPEGNPLAILISSNWQMIAMLNVLLILSGACLLYSLEFSDDAIQKMKSLPIKESQLFLNKVSLLICLSLIPLILEMIAMFVGVGYWFELYEGFGLDLVQNFGFFFLMTLPTILLALLVATFFESVWVSLGINVTAVFLATMIYNKSFSLSLFPFALAFQRLHHTNQDSQRIIAVLVEVVVITIGEVLFLKTRRHFA